MQRAHKPSALDAALEHESRHLRKQREPVRRREACGVQASMVQVEALRGRETGQEPPERGVVLGIILRDRCAEIDGAQWDPLRWRAVKGEERLGRRAAVILDGYHL